MGKIPVKTFYEYAAMQGWFPFEGVYEQKPYNTYGYECNWGFIYATEKWLEQRDAIEAQYKEDILLGKVRPPTRMESLRMAANGHVDNASTQAARRILRKMSRAARDNAICCPS